MLGNQGDQEHQWDQLLRNVFESVEVLGNQGDQVDQWDQLLRNDLKELKCWETKGTRTTDGTSFSEMFLKVWGN